MTRILLLMIMLAGPAYADMPARVELIPGWRTDQGTHMAGLRIRLRHGWKTYWRSPGDAGIPPSFDLSASRNLSGMQIHWPTPQAFDNAGMRVIGYKGDIVLPIEFTVPDADAPAQLRGRIDLGVCEEICMPISFELSADLPVATRRAPKVVAALLDGPRDGGAARCDIAPGQYGFTVQMAAPSGIPNGAETVIEHPGISISEPQIVSGAAVAQTYGQSAIARSDLVLTVLDGQGGAVEYRGCE